MNTQFTHENFYLIKSNNYDQCFVDEIIKIIGSSNSRKLALF